MILTFAYSAFIAEAGALATLEGDVSAGPAYCASAVPPLELRATAASSKQRRSHFIRMLILSPQF
jgi:hypothetical protein